MIHDLIDRFFSSRIVRFLMMRHICPFGLKEIKIIDVGYLRYKDWGDYYEYREVWVEPKYRKKGWGSKLMDRLAEIAKEKGIKEIYVRANTDGKSDTLGKFITKNGFEPCKKYDFTFRKIV